MTKIGYWNCSEDTAESVVEQYSDEVLRAFTTSNPNCYILVQSLYGDYNLPTGVIVDNYSDEYEVLLRDLGTLLWDCYDPHYMGSDYYGPLVNSTDWYKEEELRALHIEFIYNKGKRYSKVTLSSEVI